MAQEKNNTKKVVVITGGSKGIGLECARQFLKEGYHVINASRTNPNPLKNKNYSFVKTDVSKEKDVRELFETVVKKFGGADTLINNAGYGVFGNLAESKTKDFDNLFSVNVRGLYLSTKYALKSMLKNNEGTIINISSLAGKNGFAGGSLYCAAKHAVMGMSRALMLEVRENNIRVITICPGSVDTEFFDAANVELWSSRETMLSANEVAQVCLLSAKLPQKALMNEVEIRPLNPKK